MTFLDELERLKEKATKGPWYEAGCNTVHGGDHQEIAHPFNLDSTDGGLIVFLRNHADDIAELVKAAENVERYLDANRRRMPALSDALANLNKEKS